MCRTIKLVIMAVITIGILSLFMTYCLNAGRLTNKEIDLNMLEDQNPVRREMSIESCSTATVRVVSLDDYEWAGVIAKFDDRPDIYVRTYLTNRDMAKFDVGDLITVRGRVNYMPPKEGLYSYHVIVIGSALSGPPLSFDARLVKIQHSE